MGYFAKEPLDRMFTPGEVLHCAPTGSAAVTLEVYQQAVEVTVPATGTGKINLPDVALAAGRIVAIKAVAQTAVYKDGGVEVDYGGSDAVGDTMTAVGDFVVVYSDGFNWYVLKEVTT